MKLTILNLLVTYASSLGCTEIKPYPVDPDYSPYNPPCRDKDICDLDRLGFA